MKPARSIARVGALWSFCAVICTVAPAVAQPIPAAQVRAPSDPLAKLTFAPGAAAVEDAAALGPALAWAAKHPDGLIVVDGHADPTPAASSARIALARAKAVRAQLVASGANPDQIVIAAFAATPRDQSVVVWGSVTVAAR